MKPIKLKNGAENLVVGGAGGVNYPTPQLQNIAPDGELVQPPLPSQMNSPVGPPPPPTAPPQDFADCMKLVFSPRVQAIEYKNLWLQAAQAFALNRQADILEEILGFLHLEAPQITDGDVDQLPSGLSAAIADGILMARQEVEENRKPGKNEDQPKKV